MEHIFHKFFGGSQSVTEGEEIWSFLKDSEKNREEFRKEEEEWEATHSISSQLRKEFHMLNSAIVTRQRHRIIRRWSAAAACLVLLIGAGVYHVADSMRSTVYETSDGETMAVCLPDGTNVNLNVRTILSYRKNFNRKDRKVELNGEAFFDVTPDKERPFTVTMSDCRVTVLGTRFNISAYDNDFNTKVSLASGSLKCEVNDYVDILEPGDMLSFGKNELNKSRVDISSIGLWMDGIISCGTITLEDFLNRLSREYGVNVKLEAKEYARKTLSASFSHEDSIATILGTICMIFPLEIRESGIDYTLTHLVSNK